MKSNRLQRKLRQARLSQKLTLRDVERLSQKKISNPYLSQLETGHNDEPSPHKLRALASVLKLDYLELMILADYLTMQDLRKRKLS